jgi:hypothetical protein
MLKVTGKIIFVQRPFPEISAAQLIQLEMWLNSEVAAKAFHKFGIGLRVHVTGEQEIESGKDEL